MCKWQALASNEYAGTMINVLFQGLLMDRSEMGEMQMEYYLCHNNFDHLVERCLRSCSYSSFYIEDTEMRWFNCTYMNMSS